MKSHDADRNGNNGKTGKTERASTMEAQHKSLAKNIVELRSLLAVDLFSWDAARIALAQLRESLESHFTMEEAGGYLVEVTTRAPEKSALVAKLESEHSRMRGSVAQVLAEALVARSRETLRTSVEALLEMLASHERRENELVLDTFETDIPATD